MSDLFVIICHFCGQLFAIICLTKNVSVCEMSRRSEKSMVKNIVECDNLSHSLSSSKSHQITCSKVIIILIQTKA